MLLITEIREYSSQNLHKEKECMGDWETTSIVKSPTGKGESELGCQRRVTLDHSLNHAWGSDTGEGRQPQPAEELSSNSEFTLFLTGKKMFAPRNNIEKYCETLKSAELDWLHYQVTQVAYLFSIISVNLSKTTQPWQLKNLKDLVSGRNLVKLGSTEELQFVKFCVSVVYGF